MQVYQGKSVFEGVAIGKIRVYQKRQLLKQYYVADAAAEAERFAQARKSAAERLAILYQKAAAEVGETQAAIFEMHLLLLEDVNFLDFVENMIRTQKVNAEYAVAVAKEHFAAIFSGMEDEYMREKAADVRDVSEQLLSALTDHGKDCVADKSNEPFILVASDLAPSETVQLDKEKVLAFVTVQGSVNSHTAILARTMNIPALVGTALPLSAEEYANTQIIPAPGMGPAAPEPAGWAKLEGRTAIVDGYTGCFYVDPDEETLVRMKKKQEEEQEQKARLAHLKGKESVTLDGRRLKVYANIGNLQDLKQAVQNDAEGIGLFRSEFLFLEKDAYPTEEEQFTVYKTVAETMQGKRVVIRTLDVGADKQVEYLKLAREENPAMGCRAIRMCLQRPQMFKTQLRALFRAGIYGNLAVMYPMITSLKEIQWIRELVEEVKAELAAANVPYGHVEQGIMIETPAAAVISDLLAGEVDFFSIGTNDLTQYMLAIDRQNGQLDAFYDAHHEAVLRMIRMTAENARKAGIPCGICGELAADAELTGFFAALGVEELSVPPAMVLPIRKIIRETDLMGSHSVLAKAP